ncbi:Leucine-rich repeat-containing protein sog2 [Grifola frondosa]|uniref:Leucine-rich repeat-containing protein sog2 n=1 Tax=Grifola frondosa TaxID=5627 RepID=A0A1C7LYG3_GRIFR|nr:Leucine-rich repeat-containing protein sog2 [Grifola frondosa]
MSNYDAEPSPGRISAQTLGHGASSPLPSVSLSRSHITDALSKSPDNGATLDLARKGLTDVGESGAEEMAMVGQEDDTGADSTVVRIALAYNRLTTLPMAFSLLLRLRYLVLKSNNFTVFPEVLTVMPSLEILDISRNKIKRLPSEPGSLTNLRVFSLHKNKIHRLPTYLCEFRRLSTFKVEQNPITWPPKAVMESYGNLNDAQAMSDWIKSLQAWLGDNASPSNERKLSDDSTQNEQGSKHPGQDTVIEDNSDLLQQAPSRRIPLRTPSLLHIRSLSAESDSSAYFQMDRSRPGSDTDPSPPVTRPDFASRLHDDPSYRAYPVAHPRLRDQFRDTAVDAHRILRGFLDNINGFQLSSAITNEPTTASPVSIDRSAPPRC